MDEPAKLDVSPRAHEIASAHAIGFIEEHRSGSQVSLGSAGSGTLVETVGIKGILTAAHVVERLRQLPSVGVLRFGRRGQLQGLRFNPTEAEYVTFAGDTWTSLGPDLAFIRLPPATEQALVASNTFWNLATRYRLIEAGHKAPNKIIINVVTGVVATMGTEKAFPERKAVGTEQTMMLLLGRADNYRRTDDGHDYVDFVPIFSSEIPEPTTYRGVSGGALWQFGVTASSVAADGPLDTRIAGVAFYERPRDGSPSRLVCHGPESVHERLGEAIAKRWNKRWPEDALC